MKQFVSPLFCIGMSALGSLYASTTQAQITSDGTVNTQVNNNANVAEIIGGETRGSNLFHSFQDFSVSTGNEAFFNNANDISNIFSRVTGGNISNINGLIRANAQGDSQLIANTQGEGNAGLINIEAKDSVTISGESNISSRVRETAKGDAGGIRISANSIIFDEQSRLATGTVGQGNGSGIEINATDTIALKNNSLLNSEVGKNTLGNAGGIDLTAKSVEITEDSQLIANTRGQGNAGLIQIEAQDSVSISGASNISSRVRETGQGDAGGIRISANSIVFDEQSILDAGTVGQGNERY